MRLLLAAIFTANAFAAVAIIGYDRGRDSAPAQDPYPVMYAHFPMPEWSFREHARWGWIPKEV